jgi:cyanophycinase
MWTYLIGGGRDAAAVHQPFVQAAGGPIVAFVLDEGEQTDTRRWVDTLTAGGAVEVRLVVVSPARPARADDLTGAAGIYVAGGPTPGYHRALAGAGTGWLDAARERGLAYGGFSAGAAIAPAAALIGGWRTRYRDRQVEVCHEDCAEELDELTVAPGLGLVPFLVDVHAAQWGTLYRLIHALAVANLDEGWAIDEHTALEVDGEAVTVHGSGAATRVLRDGADMRITVHVAGDRVRPMVPAV